MKLKRVLSGLLFGMGCALTFIGLLAVLLPSISNPQIQLVINSFSSVSDRPAVNAVNRFMSFAFEQGWRLFLIGLLIAVVGAWLLLLFTPRTKRPQNPPPVRKVPQPVPVQSVAEPEPQTVFEAPNPFASGHYTAPQGDTPVVKPAPVLHGKPMLEQNTIEETCEYTLPPDYDAKPYFSPRVETETRAVQASVGDTSQSGSRILIRPTPVATFIQPEAIESENEPEPVTTHEPPNVPAAALVSEPISVPSPASLPKHTPHAAPSPALRPASPRIRSTMGRHTAGNGRFTLKDS
ncbi:MAG: hypothetical protein IKK75_03045 [Clostridia bacterium]|nr:hypothetical protein [Clostridia bacterium]